MDEYSKNICTDIFAEFSVIVGDFLKRLSFQNYSNYWKCNKPSHTKAKLNLKC